MIRCRINNTKIIIKGNHQGDYLKFFALIFFISVVILLALQILYRSNNSVLMAMAILFCLVVALKYLMWFSIKITQDKITIVKRFIGFPYVIIVSRFQKVLYNKEVPILSFENDNGKIGVEIFDGFEYDGLLIEKNKKEYIIGRLEDAKVIFKYILTGLEKLNVDKINSDIGYPMRG